MNPEKNRHHDAPAHNAPGQAPSDPAQKGPSRELMFEAEMLHQQLEHLQGYMDKMDKQAAEITALKEALDGFRNVAEGDEMLVPLAAGVFLRATATADKTLHVNVGQGVVVPKSVDDVHKMLDEQLSEMRAYEGELQSNYDKVLRRLREIQEQLEKEMKQ